MKLIRTTCAVAAMVVLVACAKVPGMVLGSPGMEQGGVKQPYDVLLLAQDGSTSVYAHYDDGH